MKHLNQPNPDIRRFLKSGTESISLRPIFNLKYFAKKENSLLFLSPGKGEIQFLCGRLLKPHSDSKMAVSCKH